MAIKKLPIGCPVRLDHISGIYLISGYTENGRRELCYILDRPYDGKIVWHHGWIQVDPQDIVKWRMSQK